MYSLLQNTIVSNLPEFLLKFKERFAWILYMLQVQVSTLQIVIKSSLGDSHIKTRRVLVETLQRTHQRYHDSVLGWLNTAFVCAPADAIQHTHKDCKIKHAIDTAIILFARCLLCLCSFSS